MMWIFWVLIIVALIWLIAFAARSRSASGPPGHDKSALEILKERYARGEIDHEEFEQKKQDLNS